MVFAGLDAFSSSFIGGLFLVVAGLLFFNPIRHAASRQIGIPNDSGDVVLGAVIILLVVTSAVFIPDDGGGNDATAEVEGVTTTVAPTATPTTTPTVTSTTSTTTEATQTTSPTTTTSTGPRTAWTVTVVGVTDGDTMDVRMPDGSTETIRLLGVDTPETSASETAPEDWEGIPDTADSRRWLADWGGRATDFADNRLSVGSEIYLETDEAADRRGSFGRLLVYAYQSESASTSFNLRLLQDGYARVYDSEFSKRAEFDTAEDRARSSGTGAWGYTPPTTTDSAGASGSGSLAVADVHADADGNDHENLNDEYVVFENTGGSRLDMGGWTVSDSADHTYTIPSGFSLAPGESVTIYTGSGSNSGSSLYWGSDSAVWNNGGDTIIVTTDDRETIINYEY